MRTKKLEKFFFDHNQANPVYAEDTGIGCVLYSSEEFHINFKQKTLYCKGVGVYPLPEIEEPEAGMIEWVAIITESGQEFIDIVMGDGNPYDEKYMDMLPNQNKVIIALPNSILMKSRRRK